jgi:PAS domain S-box-containing protein
MNSQNAKVGPDSGTGDELPQGLSRGKVARLAWLPIPLLAAAIIAGRVAGLSESYKSETLTLVLSFTFYTLVSLGTLFLIARSFLALGTPGLLLLECGVVLWSLAGTVGDAVSHGDANVNVTIFNTGILLAGLCHLAGSILSLRPQRALRATPLWLGVGFALSVGTLWLVTHAALANWLPVFFIPGQGGTLVRYCVLISAIALFALSASLLLSNQREVRAPFTSWYALSLLLLAVGLFGVMIQLSLGCVVNWLGRTAQWLGGVYLLLAAVATLRESQLPLFPTEKKSRPKRYVYGVAIAIVFAATAIRLVFLPTLGSRVTFLTFYPAVMLAALYGGLRAGLLATFLTAIIAGFSWIAPVGQFNIGSPIDWVSLVFFVLACLMISFIIEAMHRARDRASLAETQALLAAERETAADFLQKSEERYHTLFTGMTEGFAIHELLTDESGKPVDYRFLDVNPAFERLTGLKRQEVVGKTHNEVLPGNDSSWLRMYSQVALTGQPVQFENYAPALRRHYEVLAYRPAPMQFAVIFMDVTDRKQAEEALKRAHDELEVRVRERTAELAQRNEELTVEIAERLKMEQALQESKNQLRILASQTLSAQENERKRIALEVHDVLGSSLSAIKFKAEEVLLHLPRDGVLNISKPLEALITLVLDTIGEARRIQADLRPPLLDDLGILATLSWFCRRFETIYSGIEIEQAITVREEELPDHLKLSLFRITQEAMNNIGKHAKADSVYLGLKKVDSVIELRIKDNGEGFDLESLSSRDSLKKGLGLSSMKERVEFSGGSFSIDSAKGKGTTIKAIWPR